ncbi:MAG: 30S ribosomal protein S17 [Candidatus Aenigmarchaeota archaeon]|nr:30S ribosomal protein S17 [Candidatus Aenigmarchaeota archaeon]
MAKRIKTIGLEAKPPGKKCDSELCPWHGHIKVRGSVFTGEVKSIKPADTAIVRWNYYRKIAKYERYERRRTVVAAHKPKCIDLKVGDGVKIAECRPISKTKKFVVVEKIGE